MFRVIDNEIEMIRGDSAVFDLTLLDYRGYQVDLSTFEDGEIVFTVKAGTYTNKVSIQKEVVDGRVELDPGDTEDLSYGKYVYDVQIRMPNGYTDTVIPPSPFRLLREVNF